MSISKEIILKTIPEKPGVYQFINKDQTIIYVGKAKNLKKRVSSYFQKNIKSRKTVNLVKNIHKIEHVVVPSESDALLLENSLIKKNQPKYNILLRDDKTYPWICIKNEPFPRVFVTRKLVKDGSQYFGPFTSFKTINTIMGIIKKLYPLRNCSYNLSEKNITEKKYKVCLEYHLGNCLGGCELKQTKKDYDKGISEIKEILKGNISKSKKEFKKKMIEFSNKEMYEEAQKIKDKIDVVILPLFAFDLDGNRIGYGKGFYDNFISNLKSEPLKIGISYFSPEKKLESNNHDINLDYCITPNKIFSFSGKSYY